MAADRSLSKYEKIGFPDKYRKGKEKYIFDDIASKLTLLLQNEKVILDIGPGCSGLALRLIELCERQQHTLILADSQEMLDNLPDKPFIIKMPGYYPDDCSWLFEEYSEKVNVVLAYSVLHYIFAEGSLFRFLDQSLGLLAHGGEMLIGDIPSLTKRKRFFKSPAGIAYHQKFTGTKDLPVPKFNRLECGQIDDAILISILLRYRSAGFDAYLMPQPESLPMANRREDILIRRP